MNISLVQENPNLGLELYIDYDSYTVYMMSRGKKVAEYRNPTLSLINNLISDLF